MPADSFSTRISRFFGNENVSGPGPKDRTEGAETRRSICCFCSCGCGIEAKVRDEKLLFLEGDPRNPINEGTLCSKGAAAAGLHTHPDRLVQPRVRRAGSKTWESVSWPDALRSVAERLYDLRDDSWHAGGNRADGLAFLGGAVNTNEEAYLFKKLASLLGVIGVEHQARI